MPCSIIIRLLTPWSHVKQVPDVQAVVVPVGGGGMISGIAVAIKTQRPQVKIYAAEPENADDCYRSKQCGCLTPNASPPVTVADGVKTSIGEKTWPIIRDLVDDVFTVTLPLAILRLSKGNYKAMVEELVRVGWKRSRAGKTVEQQRHDEGTEGIVAKLADDAKVGRGADSVEEVGELQKELDRLGEWAKKWQMEYNVG
eukprot:g36681.t1